MNIALVPANGDVWAKAVTCRANPAEAEQVAEKGWFETYLLMNVPQGLKPEFNFAAVAARVNSCPDTRPCLERVFPQPVKPTVFYDSFR